MRRALFLLALLSFGPAAANYGRTPSGRGRGAQGGSSYQAQAHPDRSIDSSADAPGAGPGFRPSIPQAWDEGTVVNLQLPLADPKQSPVEIPWEYYYRIPRRLIYKSYPVYAPGHEPPGYFEWLKRQEPQGGWGVDYDGQSHTPQLQTEADWIRAGELVFDAPIAYDSDPWGLSVASVGSVR